MIRHYAHKLLRYTREIGFCLRVGDRSPDKIHLAVDTIRFHMRDLMEERSSKAQNTYRIRWKGTAYEVRLRPFAGDFFIFHEVFLDEHYWIPPDYAQDAETVVDLGANVGLASIYLSGLVPQARFVCVEPNPTNVPLLRHNVSSIGKTADIVEAAVADQSGSVQFAAKGPAWGTKLAEDETTGTEVDVYSMSDLLHDQQTGEISILKIDVEGAEHLLFRGDNSWLDRVQLLMIELHEEYRIEEFVDDVRPHGFDVFRKGSAFGNNILTAARTS